MKLIHKSKKEYVVRLERGEKYPDVFLKFLKKQNITGGFFYGLGAVESPRIAYFNLRRKKYVEKKLRGVYEVLNIVGNVALSKKEVLVHQHVVLSDWKYKTFGGHLVNGVIGGTLELCISKITGLRRKRDKKTNITLLV